MSANGDVGIRKGQLALAFLFFLLMHLVIFRGVIADVPAVMSGDKIVTSEELVPIFDIQTQFLDQLQDSYSDLTSNAELRVRYSFLTTWARYYWVLPFSLVVLNALSCWLLFLSILLLLRRAWRHTPKGHVLLCSSAAAIVIHSVLLYSKITHFYTLIFGFSLFALASTLLLMGLYDGARPKKRYLVISALLILINPAVHYHVLFCIVLAIALLVCAASARQWSPVLKKIGLTCGIYLALWLVPYWMFVTFYVLQSGSDVSESIPVTFATISSGSPSLLQIYCLDVAATVDNFLSGSFIKHSPRTINLLYLALSLVPLLLLPKMMNRSKDDEKETRVPLLLTLYLISIASIWLSLGYHDDFSLHSLLRSAAPSLYASDSWIAQGVLSFVGQVVQVLRFPHRFQFLIFYSMGVLAAIALTMVLNTAIPAVKNRRPNLAPERWMPPLLAILLILPLAISTDHRSVLQSGNYGGFLEPYAVPQDLKDIRDILQGDTGSYRILVLPSVGGGLHVEDIEGNTHILHDKFYIYYLNKPSMDYALSGSLQSKQQMFLLYRAFHYNEDWWINVLRNNDVKYVVLNKEVVPRECGKEYLPGIAEKIESGLSTSSQLEKVHDGDRYDLFMLKDFDGQEKERLLLDVDWKTYLNLMKTEDDLFWDYNVFHLAEMDLSATDHLDDLTVAYTDETKCLIDIQASIQDSLSKPDTRTLPFSEDLIPSTRYTDNMFSMFNLLGNSDYNPYSLVIPGMFDTLDSTFMGTTADSAVRIPVSIDRPGTYTLYLRGKFTDNRLSVSLDGCGQTDSFHLEASSAEQDVLYEYEYLPVWRGNLETGKCTVWLEKSDDNPMVIEGIVALGNPLPSLEDMPVKLVPVQQLTAAK